MPRRRSSRAPGRRGARHGRHGRLGRSEVVRPPLPPLDGRLDRFDVTVGSAVEYLRGAWERMVLDQVQWLTDPAAAKSFRRKQQDLARNYGQGFWWRPGEAVPGRAPAMFPQNPPSP